MSRNKNIFIRKETLFSLESTNLPVFAMVVGYHQGSVHYIVDYPERYKKNQYIWHYSKDEQESGTYIKPLEEFLQRFSPDYDNEYQHFSS